MERKYEEGSHVIYVDSLGVRHEALVTVFWLYPNMTNEPGCNLIYVSSDPLKKDTYGRQTEHATSIVHKSMQSAPAFYWIWPDEV